MRADLETLAKLFCPDGAVGAVPFPVPVPEEREHAGSVSVAYRFRVESNHYLLELAKPLRDQFPDNKPAGVALRFDIGTLAPYVPYLQLPVIAEPTNTLIQSRGAEIDVHVLNAGNGFFGRMVHSGDVVVGAEYVKTSFSGEPGMMTILLVGIYRKE